MLSATGTYEHSLDAKGRLFIPAQLRKELGDTLYVTMGLDGCLAVYPQETWDTFTERFASMPMSQSKAMRPLFANAAKCEPDSQGRIVIPQKLRTFAGLGKDAVIIGVHNRAEIWSAERWKAEEEEEMTPEKMNEILGGLGL
ncbi:MAG TPA: division/cell wall cluster transcriptional repressor MraZ [Candidatus Galloscillospira excrementavium]|nr:division/cell wall cluster transcriptional repressor MraZ [Candidatus Galloscillospira excrementavium]